MMPVDTPPPNNAFFAAICAGCWIVTIVAFLLHKLGAFS